MTHSLRARLGLAAALGASVLALLTPAHQPASVPVAAGPPTITNTWPRVTPFTMPGTVGGDAYAPLAIIGDGDSIGSATSGDGSVTNLVEVIGTTPRILQAHLPAAGVSFDAFASTTSAIYWMRNTADAQGVGHETLWTADRRDGPAHLLSSDVGNALFQGGADDLRIAGGELQWVATSAHDPDITEIRSIPLAGGTVAIRTVRGNYVLGPAPWLISEPAAAGTPVVLANLDTGERRSVPVKANTSTTCSLTWCVVQRLAAGGASQIALTHLDGSGAEPLGTAQTDLVATDATQLDRFVILADTVAGQQGPTVIERLSLFDIAKRRNVLISPAATAAYARGSYVWWSTGDNETLSWSALNLATLN